MDKPEGWDEILPILRELHAFAGAAALENALEPLEMSTGADWHVIDVQPDTRVAWNEPMCWHVQIRFRDTQPTHWEYITSAEIFAYRLRVAMARDNEKEMMLL